jgi:pyruvate kinase
MKPIKTKIIATIGPSTNTYDSLKKLHKAGFNVARFNMSHDTHADAQNIIDIVHQINSEQSVDHGPIGLLLDTQGPEIRTGFNQSDIDLKVGDNVNLTMR